jgi:hypothetical protein
MRRLPLALASLAALMTLAGPALAFNTLKRNGYETRWTSTPVTWYLNPNGSNNVPFNDVQAAIQAAFNTWQGIPCADISFNYGGTQSYGSSSNWNGIYLRFQSSGWDPSVGDAAAYSVSWQVSGGSIQQNEVVFNEVDMTWTTQDQGPYSTLGDIQGVATHELGHSIGLDHSKIFDATMYWTGGSAELRDLEPDDENGACYLYGSFSQGQPCDACSDDSHCAGGGTCIGYPDGGAYCGAPCTTNSQCSDLYFCYTSDSIYQCVDDHLMCSQEPGDYPIEMGEYCWGMDTCESGFCLPLPSDAYCSKECNPSYSSCPSDFTCMDVGDGQGYCIQAGNVDFGGACTTHLECASSMCAQICYGDGALCTLECTSDAQCPGNSPCWNDMCIPSGPTAFGGGCGCHADCQTGYCGGMYPNGFCSRQCTSDSQCPETYCGDKGHCVEPGSGVGATCKTDANCGADMFCKFGSPYEEEGECAYHCEPISDNGCPDGWACTWYWMNWSESLEGQCLPANGGGGEGQACDPATSPCEVNLICADAGQGLICYRDCKLTSPPIGCDPGQTCIGIGGPSDPLHGLCIETPDQPNPDPDPIDVVEPPDTAQPDTAQPDTAQPDTAQPDTAQPDTATPQPDTPTPQPDTAAPQPDTTGGGGGGGGDGGFARDEGGGGCSLSARGGAGLWTLLLLLLALSVLRVRRVRSL